jgi:hypothetical protein
MTDTFTTRHGTFGAGEAIWHVGPCGERTRAGTIRDVGPAFTVIFHDAAGVHLVPSDEIRKPGSWVAPRPAPKEIAVKQFVVCRFFDGEPMFAAFPDIHDNRRDAVEEAADRAFYDRTPQGFGVFKLTDVVRRVSDSEATVTRLVR